MASVPTVLYPLTLPALLDYVLSTQSSSSPTTLVICSDRRTFLEDLAYSLKQQQQGINQTNNLQQLLIPTLNNLSTTRHVKIAFCASVQALLAYLTAFDRPGYVHVDESGGRDRLVLVNLLALHEPTSSFSAQGLSRTFAAAVETALRTEASLHVVECEDRREGQVDDHGEDEAMPDGEDAGHVTIEEQDPWDRDVSILNVSARRFGSSAGERAWAGRTVKAKRIAARWFHFHEITGHLSNEELG